MDIWKFAEDHNYGCDYLDITTGNIYHIQEYYKKKLKGIPVEGIAVTNNGRNIGYVPDQEHRKLKVL